MNHDNEAVVMQFYEALATMDVEKFWACQSPEVVYNVSGHSPISGQIRGRAAMERDILPQVFGALDPKSFRFCTKLKVFCSDGNRVACLMEADGNGTNGERYDQRYCQLFELENGKIVQVWEFFDTMLARKVMFPDPAKDRAPGDSGGFDF
jgi:ketosteroid isomerase-like protein